MIKSAIKSGRKNYCYYMSTLSSTEFVNMVKDKIIDPSETTLDIPFGIVILVKKGEHIPKWYPGTFEKDSISFYNIGVIEFFEDTEFTAVIDKNSYEKIKNDVGSNEDKNGAEIPVMFMIDGSINQEVL